MGNRRGNEVCRMSDKSEQWLSDGKCHICRRREYCSKPCKACKDRREYEMKCYVSQAMLKRMVGK